MNSFNLEVGVGGEEAGVQRTKTLAFPGILRGRKTEKEDGNTSGIPIKRKKPSCLIVVVGT